MTREVYTFRAQKSVRKLILWSWLAAWSTLPALAVQNVALTWNPSTNSDVAGYNIYCGTQSQVYTNMVTVANVTNTMITGLVEGTTYYFSAKSHDSSTNESAFSNETTFTVPAAVVVVPPVITTPVVVIPDTNNPPTLNAISNLVLTLNAAAQTVPLSGITSGATNENQVLKVTVVSSNPNLIKPAISYVSPKSTGTLTFKPTINLTGTALITVTVNDGGTNYNIATQSFTVTVTNSAPTLNAIGNLILGVNAAPQTIPLSGITSGATNEAQVLKVTAVSSNAGLIRPTVSYISPKSTGTLTFRPTLNAAGTSVITVTVSDGNLTTQNSFTVTVTNRPPTIDAIANLSVNENAGSQTVPLTGITSGATNESQMLRVTAASSNTGLIRPTVSYISPRNTGSVTFRPTPNASGTSVIIVTVSDGITSTQSSFTVTVAPSPADLPKFTKQLANSVMLAGKSVSLSVSVTGKAPFNYQWKLNGTNLPSAMGATLILPSVTTSQAGTYSVQVSNSAGMTNSIPASLVVLSTPGAILNSAVMANGQYSFQVTGLSGSNYVVQVSSDLTTWTSAQTNTSPFTFIDTEAGNFAQRYYRSYYLP